ncbi:cadherin-17 [Spea bombifrons]|uniref:cadherin-17 n=1 Tax=Spea bombifrons TaxID=233779 RepID=UPI002348FEAE|nr:cadherin-17 [Spea bombifrons]
MITLKHLAIFTYLITIQGLVRAQIQTTGNLMDMNFKVKEGSPASLIYQFLKSNPNSHSFVLEGQTDGAIEIQSEDGRLQTTKPLDRETKALYQLKIKTVNKEYALVEGPYSINIIVEDINDNIPVFNQSRYEGKVRENSRPGIPFVTVYATDADDPETPNAQLHYEILQQIPDPYKVRLFQINNKTGAIYITLNGSQLLDSEAHNSYELLIGVSDSAERPFRANTKVFVTVLENIWLKPKPVTIVENSTEPHPIKITQVRWNDDGAIFELHQREKYLKFPFSIDKNGDIYVTEPLDREERPQYIFYAIAKNQNGVPLARPVEVEVNVDDINDNPPVCPEALTIFEVQENEEVGAFIGTLKATDMDQDQNSLLHYRLLSQNPTKPQDTMFFVSEYSGDFQLLTSALSIQDVDVYLLTVEVSDEGSPAYKTTCEVQVKVIDVNDQIPIFETSDYGNVTIAEDTPLQTVVFTIQATDADQPNTGSSEIIYAIIEGDLDKMFSIHTNKTTNKGYVKIVKPLDFEKFRTHALVIQARNPEPFFGGVNLNESSITRLQVIVTDVDEKPYFEHSTYQKQVSEDIPIGTKVITIEAKDPEGDDIIYALKGDSRKWLWINESSGEIYSDAILDRETAKHYEVEVAASEKKNKYMTSSVYLRLYLDDVNDNAPTLASSYKGPIFCYPLKSPETIIIEGTDADTEPNARRLRFSPGHENVTKDWEVAYINGSHARLTMKHTQFNTGILRVPIKIRDNGRPPSEAISDVSLTICTCSAPEVCESPPAGDSRKPSIGMALGILFGVLAVIGVIVAAVFISISSKKKKQKKASGKDATLPSETANLSS